MSWGLVLLICVAANLAMVAGALWYINNLYNERFDSLATILAEAMAERDAAFQKFRATIMKLMVTDSQIFDVMLDDPHDRPVPAPEEAPNVD
jgi:hypothetical protein